MTPCDCPLCQCARSERIQNRWLWRPLPWWCRYNRELIVALCLVGAVACVWGILR